MPGVATLPALLIATFLTVFACAGELIDVPTIMNIAVDKAKNLEFLVGNIRHAFYIYSPLT
jgi:hypothetical protein